MVLYSEIESVRSLVDSAEQEKNEWRLKYVAYFNAVYFLVQIVAAISFNSLAVMSDAFHNMGDVGAVVIALYAMRRKDRDRSESMTFGWQRAEVIGGMINGIFLLGLCFYIFIEAIPRMFDPPRIDANWTFLLITAMGIPVNLSGVVLFWGYDGEVPHAHSHGEGGGHGHSHGGGHGHSHGGGHGHSHGGGHGHSHGDGEGVKGHGHSHGDGEGVKGHGHSHGDGEGVKGHGHSHGDGEGVKGHGHSHGDGEGVKGHGHSHGDGEGVKGHGHSHGDGEGVKGHGHSHGDGEGVKGHGHSHGDGEGVKGHGHSHGDGEGVKGHGHNLCKDEEGSGCDTDSGSHSSGSDDVAVEGTQAAGGMNINMWAVFIHSVGDALTSAVVLCSGLLMHLFNDHDDSSPHKDEAYVSCNDTNDCNWTDWLDATTSVILVTVITITTYPVVVVAVRILMQGTPVNMYTFSLQRDLQQIKGVIGVRDLHCWQLDGGSERVLVGSVHLLVHAGKEERVLGASKAVFHSHGVHSTTVQLDLAEGEQRLGLCQPACCERDMQCCPDEYGPLVPKEEEIV